jgi:hypothetical protein
MGRISRDLATRSWGPTRLSRLPVGNGPFQARLPHQDHGCLHPTRTPGHGPTRDPLPFRVVHQQLQVPVHSQTHSLPLHVFFSQPTCASPSAVIDARFSCCILSGHKQRLSFLTPADASLKPTVLRVISHISIHDCPSTLACALPITILAAQPITSPAMSPWPPDTRPSLPTRSSNPRPSTRSWRKPKPPSTCPSSTDP